MFSMEHHSVSRKPDKNIRKNNVRFQLPDLDGGGFHRCCWVLVLASWIGCLGCDDGVISDTDEKHVDEPGCLGVSVPGDVWSVSLDQTEYGEENLLETSGQLFIPDNVKLVSARVVFIAHGLGEGEFACGDWRTFAEERNLALMSLTLKNDADGTPWRQFEAADEAFWDLLEELEEESDRPDLEDAPLILWGHSAGGYLSTQLATAHPEEVAGFVAYHGSRLYKGGSNNGMYELPGLFILAEYDTSGIRAASIDQVALGRSNHALWGLAIEKGGLHWDNDSGRKLALAFADELLERQQIVTGVDSILRIHETDGWLGKLDHTGVFDDGDEEFEDSGHEVVSGCEAIPYNNCSSDPEDYQWLISDVFAQQWVEFCLGTSTGENEE
jgi:pimeloyl-ACP methyl ester carboxylesterase